MQKKKSKSYTAYKEATARATAVAVNNQLYADSSEHDDDVDNYNDDDGSSSIPSLILKPPSQLIRTITSKNNTIQRERSKRKAAEEESIRSREKLKKVTLEAWRDKQAGLELIQDAKREGVEKMAAADKMIEETTIISQSVMDANLHLKKEYSQKLREERQHWTTKITEIEARHTAECEQYKATIPLEQIKLADEKSRMTAKLTKQLAEVRREMEKETIRAEEAEANVEGLQNSIREEKIQQRQRVQHIFNENAELRERNEMLAKLLHDAKKEVKAISKALSAAEKKATRAISLAAERKEEVWIFDGRLPRK
jgi:hypothetical protein